MMHLVWLVLVLRLRLLLLLSTVVTTGSDMADLKATKRHATLVIGGSKLRRTDKAGRR